jgi:soluble lytic murein transglycosylase-like protein
MNARTPSFVPLWLAAAGSVALIWPLAANAELWGYVDGAGVAHVAPVALDSRYQLVLGDAPRAAQRRVPGKTDRAGDLLTWLEYAPESRVLQPILREAARATGVDVELLRAVIAVESGFDGRAVSPRGAVGLMQITPDTADRYASRAERQRPAAERLLDARINVLTGARMLADLTRRFGSIDIALAAWNAGEGTVRKLGGKMPPIEETRAHVQLVLELYWAMLQDRQSFLATQMTLDAAAP